jgi:hypothetical protein
MRRNLLLALLTTVLLGLPGQSQAFFGCFGGGFSFGFGGGWGGWGGPGWGYSPWYGAYRGYPYGYRRWWHRYPGLWEPYPWYAPPLLTVPGAEAPAAAAEK